MKNWINGFGTGVTLCLAVAFCLWINHEYKNTETAYTQEQRAMLDKLFADKNKDVMVYLSAADIGLDAEMVMEEARGKR